MPSIKNELEAKEEILSEVIIANIILDSLTSLAVKINSIILGGDKDFIKLRKLVNCTNNAYSIRRDYRVFHALNNNYSRKIDDLKNNLINDNKQKFENEIKLIKNKFEKVLNDNQQKNEADLEDLKNKLDIVIKNNNIKLDNLFDYHEKQLNTIKNNEYEDKKSKDKIFEDFVGESRVEKDEIIQKFEKSFNKIQTDWKRIQQIKTENVYLNAYHKNTARSKNSENKFIAVTALSLFLSVLTIIAFIFRAIDFSQFISIKIMIVVFFGILIAYYLRISTHYRRLADQAEQTHLELLAFPQYAAELGEEKSREIKEQLALKYFGKEIDASGYQKISDIAQEQLKTSSELVKAAASLSVASAKTTENSSSTTPNNSTNQSGKNRG
ncbi:hypothetical protein [Acinetobacter sp. NBRC 100985]|uniref:hypothetical protein n=1 Tax=Acinetobacter sp. NBRC 100985 TaxID=1071390 RepID=UPI000235FC8E|nr:hypothetical protein [Acinetobacter sp. NBRC 100985]GAB03223.1 hypothetical protein ACT4_053_00230 [Acinetobacter sp. NBRC 100985]